MVSFSIAISIINEILLSQSCPKHEYSPQVHCILLDIVSIFVHAVSFQFVNYF